MIELDQSVFLFFNRLHHPMLDPIMVIISHRLTWIPLYLLFVGVIVQKYRHFAWDILVVIVGLIAFTDRLTSGLMKPFFARLRPCYEPRLQEFIHLVGNCGGEYGFVSSHAANSFGIATLLILLFKGNKYRMLLLVWAVLVTYSRIYIGVHYPADVIVGALIGIFSGYFAYFVIGKLIN